MSLHLDLAKPAYVAGSYAHNLNRARPIFKAAFSSLSYALRPNPHVSKLIRSARNELLQILSSSVEKGPSIDPGLFYPQYIGVHVRRGDKHPSSSRYRTSYIPILDYVGAAKSSWTRLRKDDGHDLQKFPAVYLASDAPSALEEFKKEYGSSDLKIFSLSLSTDPNLAALASPKEYVQKDFNEWTLGRRVNATKGMLVDFALLSGAWSWEGDLIPDAVVCTVRWVLESHYSSVSFLNLLLAPRYVSWLRSALGGVVRLVKLMRVVLWMQKPRAGSMLMKRDW